MRIHFSGCYEIRNNSFASENLKTSFITMKKKEKSFELSKVLYFLGKGKSREKKEKKDVSHFTFSHLISFSRAVITITYNVQCSLQHDVSLNIHTYIHTYIHPYMPLSMHSFNKHSHTLVLLHTVHCKYCVYSIICLPSTFSKYILRGKFFFSFLALSSLV